MSTCALITFATQSNAKRPMVNTQKSPLLFVVLAFVAGITLSAFSLSPGFWGLGFAGLATTSLYFCSRKRILPRIQQAMQVGIMVCFLLTGWLLGEISAIIPSNDPSRFIGQELEVEGYVVDDVRPTTFGFKTVFQCTSPLEGKVVFYMPKTAESIKTNDILRGNLKLTALSQKNPGYASWLHHQGVHAAAKDLGMMKVGEKTGLGASLSTLRSRIAKQMSSCFPHALTGGLSNAMLLGDRTELDSDLKKDFSVTGLSHIVAISGMNFAIIYGVLNLLLRPMLYLRNGRQYRSLIVVPLLAFFALLTGANPAVVRAAIMLGMLDLGQAFWQKNNSLNALATSALIFLAIDPQSLFSPDFQLSYAAVLGILLLQNPILHYMHLRLPKLPKMIASGLAVTMAATIATTPLVTWHFHTFPTYFLIANMLVLPLVTLVVQIGFAGFIVAWIPGLNEAWGGIMDFLLWAITGMADLIAQLPGATITALEAGQTGIWILLAQIAACFFVLERRFLKKAILHIGKGTRSKVGGIAVFGLKKRLGIVSLIVGWIFVGFLLG